MDRCEYLSLSERGAFASLDFAGTIAGDKAIMLDPETAYPHRKIIGQDEHARPCIGWVLKGPLHYDEIPALDRVQAVAAYLAGGTISLRANRPDTLASISAAFSRDVVRVADAFGTEGTA